MFVKQSEHTNIPLSSQVYGLCRIIKFPAPHLFEFSFLLKLALAFQISVRVAFEFSFLFSQIFVLVLIFILCCSYIDFLIFPFAVLST